MTPAPPRTHLMCERCGYPMCARCESVCVRAVKVSVCAAPRMKIRFVCTNFSDSAPKSAPPVVTDVVTYRHQETDNIVRYSEHLALFVRHQPFFRYTPSIVSLQWRCSAAVFNLSLISCVVEPSKKMDFFVQIFRNFYKYHPHFQRRCSGTGAALEWRWSAAVLYLSLISCVVEPPKNLDFCTNFSEFLQISPPTLINEFVTYRHTEPDNIV